MATRHGDLILTGGGDDRAGDRIVQRQAAEGLVRRVADGVYAASNARPVEEIVCGAWAPLLARLAPGSVVHGRSAMRAGPWRARDADGLTRFPGYLFATDPLGADRKRLSLPGLEIRTIPGCGPLEGDIPYLGIHLPGEARCLLENLEPSRSRDGPSRTVGRAGVEERVERLLATIHEDGLRGIRATAEAIAPALGAAERLPVLSDIIGKVLGTRNARLSSRKVAARHRARHPYDPDCLDRLRLLATGLGRIPLPDLPDPHTGTRERTCVSFVEAYFSNYIEGTRFLVDKARRIVFDDAEPDGRPADGRDVTQTFAQIAAIVPGAARCATYAEFADELRGRNRDMLDARPDKSPGRFKLDPNRAGNTVFVLPDLVEGTLREGFAMLSGIQAPFARGLFTHALVVLVHPFDDGNGRLSRVMMTKELVAGGQCRAVVPTIYRSDYIGGLRALSQDGRPDAAPIVRAMLRCQDVTARIASPDLDETLSLWASTHAFLEDERGARLTSPDPALAVVSRRGIPAPEAYWADIDLAARMAGDDDASAVFGR